MTDLSRRALLRRSSLAGGCLLLQPFLERLHASDGSGPSSTRRPKRFVFFLEPNGVQPASIHPKGVERRADKDGLCAETTLVDRALAGKDLPPILEPLAPFRDRLTIIEGLSGRMTDTGHASNFGALGCYKCGGHSTSTGTPKGPTVDHLLGQALPAIFPQVMLGLSPNPNDAIIYNCSAAGPGRKLPTIAKPILAYNRLFGSVADGTAARESLADRNLLDFMRGRVARVRGELGGAGREQLDAYLDAYENMYERHGRLGGVAESLRRNAPKAGDAFRSEVESERLAAHCDIAAAALASGLTNVVTLSAGAGYPYIAMRYTGLGMDVDCHGLGHSMSTNGLTWDQAFAKIRRWQMEQLARLIGTLQRTPDGDGTLWDSTVVVYMSENGEKHHSTCYEWPVIVLGSCGRKPTPGGRLLCYPGYGKPGHRTIANLHMAFLHAAGRPVDTFGHPDGNLGGLDLRGPLQELLA